MHMLSWASIRNGSGSNPGKSVQGATLVCRGPLNWEPPEVAKALLEQRLYQPQPSSDMWSLGQLMLYTVSGSVPYEQWELQNSDAYLQDIGPRCLRPADLPAPRRHLEYLDKLLVDAGSRDYADEVGTIY